MYVKARESTRTTIIFISGRTKGRQKTNEGDDEEETHAKVRGEEKKKRDT
jgi:hypothetical protein